MPLFDYRCEDCATEATLLLRLTDPAHCPTCGSAAMTKLVTPFAFSGAKSARGGATTKPRPPSAALEPQGHVHGPGCGHGSPAEGASGCDAATRADALIKKYLD